MDRRGFLSLIPAAYAARMLRAQDPSFSAGVKVVNVFATVRDKQGKLVRDLTQEDFIIEDEGKYQSIKYFSKESDLPLTLGLVIDTSGSMRGVLDQERRASHRFIEQVLREDKDKAFLIHFDREVELLQDLTGSRTQLDKGLDKLQIESPRQLNRRDSPDPNTTGGRGRGRGRGAFGGTSLYDAVLLASDELMRKQTGRKALIVLSDGVDTSSKVPLTEAIASAQRADTLVYTMLFADLEQYFRSPAGFGGRGGRRRGGQLPPNQRQQRDRPDGKKTLERLARETGGTYFEVSSKHPIDKSYDQIQEELRNQYSLGYTPENEGPTGYRKIHVATKQKGFTVQARDGYYSGA
jgi:VWFA-related protein